MDKLKKQQADLKAKITTLLTSDGALTAEQSAELTNLENQHTDVTGRIAKLKKQEQAEAAEKAEAEADAAQVALLERTNERTRRTQAVAGRLSDTDSPTNGGVAKIDDKGRTVASFEETDETITFRVGESADAIRQHSYAEAKRANNRTLKAMGYVPRGEFKSLGEFVREGLSANGHPKFEQRVQKHFAGLLDDRGHFIRPNAAASGLSESVGVDGGYFVMPEFGGRIIDRVYNNPLWGRTDNYTVTGNNMTFLANAETSRATGSRTGGLRGYWLQEAGTITASKPTTREVTLKLNKLGIVVYLTNELIEDGGAALETYIVRKAAEEFNFMIGDALINGTGNGQPLGVMNWPSLISVDKETGQQANTLQTENIEKMYARFYAPNMPNAYWYHNQDILPQLGLMTLGIGASGVTTYLPPGGMSAAPYGTIKGRPIEPTEFNPTLGTAGDLLCADLKQMLSISKGGIAQAVSLEIQFLTDQKAVRFIMRLAAGPWESAALTPYKGTATQSSAVALATRA